MNRLYPWGMDPDFLGEDDVEHLAHPQETVAEAVREYVGDGEGMDEAVLARFVEETRVAVLDEAIEFISAGRCPRPDAECDDVAGHSGVHGTRHRSLPTIESFRDQVAGGQHHPSSLAVRALREFASDLTSGSHGHVYSTVIAADEFRDLAFACAEKIDARCRDFFHENFSEGQWPLTPKGPTALRDLGEEVYADDAVVTLRQAGERVLEAADRIERSAG